MWATTRSAIAIVAAVATMACAGRQGERTVLSGKAADVHHEFARDSRVVFMRENDGQKHIVMARGDGSEATQLTQGNAWHLYPDITPDGRRVAYAEGLDGTNLSIVVRDLEGGTTRTVSTTPGQNLHPRFSRDGNSLAYSGPAVAGGVPQVNVVRLDGNEPRVRVVASDTPCYFPSLAADGYRVLFQRDVSKTQREIVIRDLDSGEEQIIKAPGPISMSPSWSADGSWVAYTSKVDDNWDVYVTDVRSGETARVTSHAAQDFAPHFRADDTLLFATNREGSFRIYETLVESLGQTEFPARPLVTGVGDDYAPRTTGLLDVTQRQLSTIAEPARSSFGAARVGNRVYIAGGHKGSEHTYPRESFMDRLDIYDITTGTWSVGAPRPVTAHGYGLASDDRYIYAFGGFAFSEAHKPKWQSLDAIHRYDTVTGVWTDAGKLLAPRSSNAVVRVGTKVYLLGGWDSTPQKAGDAEGRFHDTIEVFDLETQQVSLAPFSLPKPLRRAFTAYEHGGKIVLVGGLGVGSTHFELLDNVTELDPQTGTARELPRLPFATFAPAAGVIGDTTYVFGGMFKTGEGSYDYVNHIFHRPEGATRWSHTGRYLSETKGFSQVVPLTRHELGVLGGHTYRDNSDAPVATFETFGRKWGQ